MFGNLLSGSYYVLAIVIICVGLVVWAVRQEGHIHELEVADRIQDQRMSDLDIHGTRALTGRLTAVENRIGEIDQRAIDAFKRASELQIELAKVENELILIRERQNINTEAVGRLRDFDRSPSQRYPSEWHRPQ